MRTYRIALALSLILPIFLVSRGTSDLLSSVLSSSPPDTKGYTIGRRITVSAFVGVARYTLTGYTSPFAMVKLEGQGIYNETQADKDGRFTFSQGFAPLTPREVCLTAIDTDGRITQPLCLPAFPVKKNISIGPLILPPTLSINQPEFLVNDTGILHGFSTPGSTVNINLSQGDIDQNVAVQTLADRNGEYSITLPTAHKDIVQVYSRTNLNKLESIASNVLTFQVLPWWLLIIKWMFEALLGLKDNLITIVFIIEVISLGYLIWFYRRSRTTTHALALPFDHFLAKRPTNQNKLDNRS